MTPHYTWNVHSLTHTHMRVSIYILKSVYTCQLSASKVSFKRLQKVLILVLLLGVFLIISFD